MIDLYEVFDKKKEGEAPKYEVINLNPRLRVPITWRFNVPGNPNLAAHMGVFIGAGGKSFKVLTTGAKYANVSLLSCDENGKLYQLKGGLGSDPIGAITTVFDTVFETAKILKLEAVLFKFPVNKMKGKATVVQKILARLCKSRSGGKYTTLDEMFDYTSTHAYVLMYRKNIDLSDIKGLPSLDEERFIPKELPAGTVIIDKKTDKEVTKTEAMAASIVKVEDARADERTIIPKIKISRQAIIQSQYGKPANTANWEPRLVAKRDQINSTPPIKVTTSSDKESTVVTDIIRDAADPIKSSSARWLEEVKKSKDTNYVPSKKVVGINNGIKSFLPDGDEKEISKIAAKIQIDYYKTISKYNGKNAVLVLKNLVNIVSDSHGMDENKKLDFTKWMVKQFMAELNPAIQNSYENLSSQINKTAGVKASESSKQAIAEYCIDAYEPINDFLIGKSEGTPRVRDVLIPNMDKAFENGIKLPKGTSLYRGMSLPREVFEKSVKDKMFYFANYVSTSLSPSFISHESNAYDKDNVDIDLNRSNADGIGDNYKGNKFNIGIIINGADVIKVLLPGDLTDYPEECEIILPRGTLVKFDKIYAKGELNKSNKSTSVMIESTVVSPKKINENTEIFDGDALINEGVVKRFSFDDFSKKQSYVKLTENTDVQIDSSMNAILDMININNMSSKFTD